MLIHDLTERYGPVIRTGRVTGVLDAAFDVVLVSSLSLSCDSRLRCTAGIRNREACTRRQNGG